MINLPPTFGANFFASFVDHRRIDAEKRQRRAAGFGRDRARQRRDHDRAGLRLPPGIDDRATAAADRLVIPHPGLGIDRLAHRAKQRSDERSCFFTHSSPQRMNARIAVGAV